MKGKEKEKLIHNSKVKRQYAKLLEKGAYVAPPPSYTGNDDAGTSSVTESTSPPKQRVPQPRGPAAGGQKGNASKGRGKHGAEAPVKSAKPNPFAKALAEAERIREERKRETEERLRQKQEVGLAKKAAKQKRSTNASVFNKKNARGQPNMKSRMDLLLDKLQADAALGRM